MAQNNQNNQQNQQNVISEEEKAQIIAQYLAQQNVLLQQHDAMPQQMVPQQPQVVDLKEKGKTIFMWIGIAATAILTAGAGIAVIKAITDKEDTDLANTVVIDDVVQNPNTNI